jgi:pilus assembly protein CpaB
MNSKRVVFLLLAIVVAGATAFLARAWLQGERAAILAQAGIHRASPATPAQKVLVARAVIHTGHFVKPDDLRWQAWPAGDLAPGYVVEGKRQLKDFVGAVARGPLGAGEPVTETKLVLAGTRGFMSAVLQPGMRAVSVPVTATSAVSGFIYAGDRVDVLLTHVLSSPQGQHDVTETILRNARADKPDVAKTATLELTPKQSEIVTLAVKMGDLSLVLRSLQDSDRPGEAEDNAPAEPGDSFTRDAQVSPLISDGPPPAPTPAAAVFVFRGSARAKQDIEGAIMGAPAASAENARPTENKAGRTTIFTRTPSVTQ